MLGRKEQKYCGYTYDEMITSEKKWGPRGEYCYLAFIKDNKIIAFGDEYEKYTGGILFANDLNYESFTKKKEEIMCNYPELYKKIINIPFAKENEYKHE